MAIIDKSKSESQGSPEKDTYRKKKEQLTTIGIKHADGPLARRIIKIRGLSFWMADSKECIKDCRAWGGQISRSLPALGHANSLGGSGKEKPSRVWSGNGAEI